MIHLLNTDTFCEISNKGVIHSPTYFCFPFCLVLGTKKILWEIQVWEKEKQQRQQQKTEESQLRRSWANQPADYLYCAEKVHWCIKKQLWWIKENKQGAAKAQEDSCVYKLYTATLLTPNWKGQEISITLSTVCVPSHHQHFVITITKREGKRFQGPQNLLSNILLSAFVLIVTTVSDCVFFHSLPAPSTLTPTHGQSCKSLTFTLSWTPCSKSSPS